MLNYYIFIKSVTDYSSVTKGYAVEVIEWVYMCMFLKQAYYMKAQCYC